MDFKLGDFTVITGRNGSGKSNIVDAIRFAKQAASTSLEAAVRDRQGIDRVRRHSSGHPFNFAIRLDLDFSVGPPFPFGDASRGVYAFEIATKTNAGFSVSREQAVVYNKKGKVVAGFDVRKGKPGLYGSNTGLNRTLPRIAETTIPEDRLFFPSLAPYPGYYQLVRAIDAIEIYSIDPAAIRAYQSHDAGDVLVPNGANLASVVKRLRRDKEARELQRITKYLAEIFPGLAKIDCETSGAADVLVLTVAAKSEGASFKIYPSNISDGTLRALATLVALFGGRRLGVGKRLVVLEEPEIALHPGAATVLMDAIAASLDDVQVLATTHSPALLNHNVATASSICGVSMLDGATVVHSIDDTAKEALAEQLYTAGELLQKDILLPRDPERLPMQQSHDIFVSGLRYMQPQPPTEGRKRA